MGVRKIFANRDTAVNHHDSNTTAAADHVDNTCSANDRIFYISKFVQLIHIHFTDVPLASVSDDIDDCKSNNKPKSKNLKKRNSSALSSSLPHLPSVSTSSDSGEDFVFDESAAKLASTRNDKTTHCRYVRRNCHLYHHCRCCLLYNRNDDENDCIDVYNNINCGAAVESFKKSSVFRTDARKYDHDNDGNDCAADNDNDDNTVTLSSFTFKRKNRRSLVERRRYSQTLSSIHVDRPFMFHVCTEFSTNVPFVLFSGCVVNPSSTIRTSY